MTDRARTAEVLGLVAPFALWGLAFATLYGAHGSACGAGVQPGDGATATRLVLAGLLLAFLSAQALLAWRLWRRWKAGGKPPVRFVRFASLVLAFAASAGTLWTGLPVLVLSICA